MSKLVWNCTHPGAKYNSDSGGTLNFNIQFDIYPICKIYFSPIVYKDPFGKKYNVMDWRQIYFHHCNGLLLFHHSEILLYTNTSSLSISSTVQASFAIIIEQGFIRLLTHPMTVIPPSPEIRTNIYIKKKMDDCFRFPLIFYLFILYNTKTQEIFIKDASKRLSLSFMDSDCVKKSSFRLLPAIFVTYFFFLQCLISTFTIQTFFLQMKRWQPFSNLSLVLWQRFSHQPKELVCFLKIYYLYQYSTQFQ